MAKTFKTFKMKINGKKTKILICARKSQNTIADIYLNQYKLDQVSEFPYLGSMIIDYSRWEGHKRNQNTHRNGKISVQ